MADNSPQLMGAAAFNSLGGPSVLQPCLWSKPAAAPGRVLVRVVAAGLNPIDCKIRAGQAFLFTPLTKLPKIPGGDVAGIVEQASPQSRFRPVRARRRRRLALCWPDRAAHQPGC